ncbi:hypothetical protein JW766_03400 [Candidatus Dojkabacteria bacterium]|nr:hypothetical protein [Candidatus Dojkabacteria bacterium]
MLTQEAGMDLSEYLQQTSSENGGWAGGLGTAYMFGIEVYGYKSLGMSKKEALVLAGQTLNMHIIRSLESSGLRDIDEIRQAVLASGGRAVISQIGFDLISGIFHNPNLDNPFDGTEGPRFHLSESCYFTVFGGQSYEAVMMVAEESSWRWHFGKTVEAVVAKQPKVLIDLSSGTGGPIAEIIRQAGPERVVLGAYTLPEMLMTALRMNYLYENRAKFGLPENFEWEIFLLDFNDTAVGWVQIQGYLRSIGIQDANLEFIITGNTANYRALKHTLNFGRMIWIVRNLSFVSLSAPLNALHADGRIRDTDITKSNLIELGLIPIEHSINADVHFLHLGIKRGKGQNVVISAFSQLQTLSSVGFADFASRLQQLAV